MSDTVLNRIKVIEGVLVWLKSDRAAIAIITGITITASHTQRPYTIKHATCSGADIVQWFALNKLYMDLTVCTNIYRALKRICVHQWTDNEDTRNMWSHT